MAASTDDIQEYSFAYIRWLSFYLSTRLLLQMCVIVIVRRVMNWKIEDLSMDSTHVFISHSHEDDDFCYALADALVRVGTDVWFDKKDMVIGRLFTTIEEQLKQRSVLILVLSRAALRSKWVKQEFTTFYSLYFEDNHRIVIPVVCGNIDENDVWPFLKEFVRIADGATHPYPKEQAIALVVEILKPHLQQNALSANSAENLEGRTILPITFADGTQGACEENPIGSGAQGVIYRSLDKHFVAKLYHPNPSRQQERIERIDRIIHEFNPTNGDSYWEELFAWPQKRITLPRFGVRSRYVHGLKTIDHFFFSKAYMQLKEEDRGSFYDRFPIALKLAEAAARLASLGICYNDYSHRNVMVNPITEQVTLLDCDSISKPGEMPPLIEGTNWYRAPELVARIQQSPDLLTDRHSLAVLLYFWFIRLHPLQGNKLYDADNPERDDELRYGDGALYIEHPTDTANHLAHQAIRTDSLGPVLHELFQRAFVTGLHHPELRPAFDEWLWPIARTMDTIIPCTNPICPWQSFVATPGQPLICPACHQTVQAPPTLPILSFLPNRRISSPITIRQQKSQWPLLIGWSGKPLHTWHTRTDAAPFYMTQAPNMAFQALLDYESDSQAWYLKNLTLSEMQYRKHDDWPKTWQNAPRGSSLHLSDGMLIRFGESDVYRSVSVTLQSFS